MNKVKIKKYGLVALIVIIGIVVILALKNSNSDSKSFGYFKTSDNTITEGQAY